MAEGATVAAGEMEAREGMACEAVMHASPAAEPALVALAPMCVAAMSGWFLASIAGVSSSVAAGAAGLAIAVCFSGRVMIGMIRTTTSES